MQPKSKLADRRRTHRRKIINYTLNVSCALTLICAIFQNLQIFNHCGRDFRLSHVSDPFWEQLIMIWAEIALSIAGLVGLWTTRGAVYFVTISFLICTVMVQHFLDLLMGLIYILTYGRGIDGVERFLKRNYHNYHLSQIFATAKINRIHTCKKCCGINGTDDLDAKSNDNKTLIPSCCPPDSAPPCTKSKAYKDGCALKLLKDEESIVMFHAISVLSIFFQFYSYRLFLNTFV